MEMDVGNLNAFSNSSLININDSESIFFPTHTKEFRTILTVVVAITSILSVIGSLLIITTFAFFKEIRTLARQVLVCLSVADLIVATASLLGLLTDFSSKFEDGKTPKHHLRNWCKTQAAFHVFATESSILWTIAVAVYMFVLVVVRPSRHKWGVKLVAVFHIVCWGIPFLPTFWLAIDGYLGYDSAATPGFCAIVGNHTKMGFHLTTEDGRVVYPIIIGYEIWLYIAFIVLPILYISVRCRVRIKKVTTKNGHISLTLQSRVKTQDIKLIFVPLVFMMLRVWSIIVDVCVYYLPVEASVRFRHSYASAVLSVLEGIGDTGQGAANAVLFCLFTNIVRIKLFKSIAHCICRRSSTSHSKVPENIGDGDENEQNELEHSSVTDSITESGQKRPLLDVNSDSCPGYRSTT